MAPDFAMSKVPAGWPIPFADIFNNTGVRWSTMGERDGAVAAINKLRDALLEHLGLDKPDENTWQLALNSFLETTRERDPALR